MVGGQTSPGQTPCSRSFLLPYRTRHGRGLGSSMGWVGLGWVGCEVFVVEMGCVGLISVTRIYTFFAIIIFKLCKSVTEIYP